MHIIELILYVFYFGFDGPIMLDWSFLINVDLISLLILVTADLWQSLEVLEDGPTTHEVCLCLLGFLSEVVKVLYLSRLFFRLSLSVDLFLQGIYHDPVKGFGL